MLALRQRLARRLLVVAGLVATGLLVASPATAAPITVERGALPPVFAEVEGGVAIPSFSAYGDVGLAVRAALGIEVPLGVAPIAVHVVASFTWTRFADTRRGAFQTAELAQNTTVYALGLRAVARPFDRLELLVDAAGGYRQATTSAALDGVETHTQSEGHALPILGAGVRYRFLDWLRLGLRWETWLIQPLDGPDVPAATAGYATPRGERWQMNLMATAAAHF